MHILIKGDPSPIILMLLSNKLPYFICVIVILIVPTDINAGGILDRVDSYIFTGALAYSFVKTFLPLYGV